MKSPTVVRARALVDDPIVTPGDPAATLDAPIDMDAFVLKIDPWIVGNDVMPTHLADLVVPPIAGVATLATLFLIAKRYLVTERGHETR